jgi:hypothetical protein
VICFEVKLTSNLIVVVGYAMYKRLPPVARLDLKGEGGADRGPCIVLA